MKTYIPLHVHSMYSLLDGLSKPIQIADRCEEIGVKSCALTDHGNIAGAIKFYTQMRSRGIKPILGCELYICDQDATLQNKENRSLSHFLVLAKNYEGWRSLIKIVSESNRPEHYYFKPRLDLDRLGQMLDGNLIGICGHLGSTLANKLVENDTIVPDWEKIELKLTLKSSFIKNYNNFSKDAKDLNVDRLTLFMLLDKTEWYVLGAKEGCFTFWINLEPDRFIELIDGKSLADDQGLWRVE